MIAGVMKLRTENEIFQHAVLMPPFSHHDSSSVMEGYSDFSLDLVARHRVLQGFAVYNLFGVWPLARSGTGKLWPVGQVQFASVFIKFVGTQSHPRIYIVFMIAFVRQQWSEIVVTEIHMATLLLTEKTYQSLS